ncbi:MAG: radical SAM protein, partial [Candidatus Aminicenantes bacterium]|nr:radical SAM protein [Candidatus Aminicenantes bacterium]
MMNTAVPFIKKMEVGERHYIYDVNTNAFLRVDKRLFDRLTDSDPTEKDASEAIKNSDAEIEEVEKNIDLMKEKGYLSGNKPNITYFHSMDKREFRKSLMEYLTKRLYRITLGVTDSCNMRCRYCAYSGKYTYHRRHGNTFMARETMRKAVDFYLTNSTETNPKNISIYGGEPLLNYDLIHDCVRYVSQEKGIRAEYNMTINGTLLTEKRMDFLAENDFSLLISIDGPSEIHGRNRVFKNGKNSFDTIY